MLSKRDLSPTRKLPTRDARVLSQIFVCIPGVINWGKEVFVDLEKDTPLIAITRVCQEANLSIPISAFYSSLRMECTLKSLNIYMGMTIRFNVRCVSNQVYIQYPNGADQRYTYGKDLISLQLQIEERTGIPVRCQLLVSLFKDQKIVTQELYEQWKNEPFWYLFFRLYVINGNLDIHFPSQRQIATKGFVFDKTEFEAYYS